VPALTLDAVHPTADLELPEPYDRQRREARADRAERIKPFRAGPLLVASLQVAGGDVVHAGDASDGGERLRLAHAADTGADHDADLRFVLDPRRFGRQHDRVAVADHGRGWLEEDQRVFRDHVPELRCVLAVVAPDADDLPRPCDGHVPTPLLKSPYKTRQPPPAQGDAPVDPGRIRFIFRPVRRGPSGSARAVCFPRSSFMKATDIRRGHVILIDGQPCRVMDFTHRTPGNLRAFVQVRLRNLVTGNTFDMRLSATDFVDEAPLETKEFQVLYRDQGGVHVMDTTSYEQHTLDAEATGDHADWLQPEMHIQVEWLNGRPVGIELPSVVELTVVQTSPVMRGATKTASTKPAKLSNGVTIQVPEFVNEGEKVRVDPREGVYLERAK